MPFSGPLVAVLTVQLLSQVWHIKLCYSVSVAQVCLPINLALKYCKSTTTGDTDRLISVFCCASATPHDFYGYS